MLFIRSCQALPKHTRLIEKRPFFSDSAAVQPRKSIFGLVINWDILAPAIFGSALVSAKAEYIKLLFLFRWKDYEQQHE
ncbi:MAG: hypothetical protein AMS22_09685 [Thiotrichales bacterium SG8_50]|nr:MAG: hypothetical protein AMS22_09685 [Thiotrichales bacterium SG8_50]